MTSTAIRQPGPGRSPRTLALLLAWVLGVGGVLAAPGMLEQREATDFETVGLATLQTESMRRPSRRHRDQASNAASLVDARSTAMLATAGRAASRFCESANRNGFGGHLRC